MVKTVRNVVVLVSLSWLVFFSPPPPLVLYILTVSSESSTNTTTRRGLKKSQTIYIVFTRCVKIGGGLFFLLGIISQGGEDDVC